MRQISQYYIYSCSPNAQASPTLEVCAVGSLHVRPHRQQVVLQHVGVLRTDAGLQRLRVRQHGSHVHEELGDSAGQGEAVHAASSAVGVCRGDELAEHFGEVGVRAAGLPLAFIDLLVGVQDVGIEEPRPGGSCVARASAERM